MSKLALFLAGMLVGFFLSLYHVRSQQLREYDLGPQTGHAAADNQDDWDQPAMLQRQPGRLGPVLGNGRTSFEHALNVRTPYAQAHNHVSEESGPVCLDLDIDSSGYTLLGKRSLEGLVSRIEERSGGF